MINQQDALQKLFVKQSLRPIEHHLLKPIKERQRLAKERIMDQSKLLPNMKMQSSSPYRRGEFDPSYMSSCAGSTINKCDSQYLHGSYSKSVLYGEVDQ